MTPLNIKRSKPIDIVAIDSKYGTHTIPWFLWPLHKTLVPQERTKKETQHKGINIILTYETKHFHMLKEGCILCRCKAQGLS
jgi:hypothetical protein